MFANEIDKCFNIVSKCVYTYVPSKQTNKQKKEKKEDKNRKKKEEKVKKKREKDEHKETLPMSMPVAQTFFLTIPRFPAPLSPSPLTTPFDSL